MDKTTGQDVVTEHESDRNTAAATTPDVYAGLDVAIRENIGTVTLNRPEILNRIDAALHVELTRCFTDLSSLDTMRAVILTSTGKAFSAGGDTSLMYEAHRSLTSRLRIVDDGRRLVHALVELPQPLIVALNGDAIGLGATVTLMADVVVAPRSAGISDPHVQFALVAGDGGCAVWPASAGMMAARRYLLTGDRLPAQEAYRLGLVTDLVDTPDQALDLAKVIAKKIASLPPLGVRGTKRALNHVMRARLGEVLDLSLAYQTSTLASDDLLEAIAAFKERRPGEFGGK
jgi:enoyl-CoA hydratase